jgi:hypothetical protein
MAGTTPAMRVPTAPQRIKYTTRMAKTRGTRIVSSLSIKGLMADIKIKEIKTIIMISST